MLYAKYIVNGVCRSVALTKENVFAICPICQREHTVDLSEVFKGQNKGLYKTYVLCPECIRNENERKKLA